MEKYVSEHTLFMRGYLEKHPEEVAEQKSGRALWWDKKPRSLETERRDIEATVPTKGYYYDISSED